MCELAKEKVITNLVVARISSRNQDFDTQLLLLLQNYLFHVFLNLEKNVKILNKFELSSKIHICPIATTILRN